MSGPTLTITPSDKTWVVRAVGAVLGESQNTIILTEGAYPDVVYFPREDIAMDFLDASPLKTTCPHKGEASYFSFAGKSGVIENAVWSYENPKADVAAIKGMLAFDLKKTTVEMI